MLRLPSVQELGRILGLETWYGQMVRARDAAGRECFRCGQCGYACSLTEECPFCVLPVTHIPFRLVSAVSGRVVPPKIVPALHRP